MVRKTKISAPKKKGTTPQSVQKGKKALAKAKVVSAEVSSKQMPVVSKGPSCLYKKLFWLCAVFLVAEAVGTAVLLTEYQLVPREAIVLNLKKGQKLEKINEALFSDKIKKGEVRRQRKLSPEEIQMILDEQKKAAQARKAQEIERANRAQKAPRSKTNVKPVEKKTSRP